MLLADGYNKSGCVVCGSAYSFQECLGTELGKLEVVMVGGEFPKSLHRELVFRQHRSRNDMVADLVILPSNIKFLCLVKLSGDCNYSN